jgi:hypothetical protein
MANSERIFTFGEDKSLTATVTLSPNGTEHDITIRDTQTGNFMLRGLASHLRGGNALVTFAGDLEGRHHPTPETVAAVAFLGATVERPDVAGEAVHTVLVDVNAHMKPEVGQYLDKLGFDTALAPGSERWKQPLPSMPADQLRENVANQFSLPPDFSLGAQAPELVGVG